MIQWHGFLGNHKTWWISLHARWRQLISEENIGWEPAADTLNFIKWHMAYKKHRSTEVTCSNKSPIRTSKFRYFLSVPTGYICFFFSFMPFIFSHRQAAIAMWNERSAVQAITRFQWSPMFIFVYRGSCILVIITIYTGVCTSLSDSSQHCAYGADHTLCSVHSIGQKNRNLASLAEVDIPLLFIN